MGACALSAHKAIIIPLPPPPPPPQKKKEIQTNQKLTPRKWANFLRDSNKKQELFAFLCNQVAAMNIEIINE